VTLPSFDASSDVVVADLAELTRAMDLRADVGCHPHGEQCAGGFESVGLDYMSGEELEAAPFFRVEKK
jgi:hypothetical protein